MFMLMLFMFCFFLGFVAMFYHLLGTLDRQGKALSDEHAQLRVLLRALESRLDRMSQAERFNGQLQAQEGEQITMTASELVPGLDSASGHDPLLHLSFDQPRIPGGKLDSLADLQPQGKNWDLAMMPDQRDGRPD